MHAGVLSDATAAISGGGTRPAVPPSSQCAFKLAVWLDEMKLPLQQGLAVAKRLGAKYVWFTQLYDEPETTPGSTGGGSGGGRWISEMSDGEIDAMVATVAAAGLRLYQISCRSLSGRFGCFHNIKLEDVPVDFLGADGGSEFAQDLSALVRSMDIAKRVGAGAVICYGLSWPGEWSGAGSWNQSPLFAMRWATNGGIISEADLDRLAAIFRHVCSEAEQRQVDVVLSMRPFHFTCCARNFAALAARVGSNRLKLQWSPGDAVLSNERDYRAGLALLQQGQNVDDGTPWLHGLHLKDVRTGAGPLGNRDWAHVWCPLGDGEVGYPELFSLLAKTHVGALYLGVATHFKDERLPPEEQGAAAMEVNVGRVKALLDSVD
jgi:sugar phosphate isomerase/epimerase